MSEGKVSRIRGAGRHAVTGALAISGLVLGTAAMDAHIFEAQAQARARPPAQVTVTNARALLLGTLEIRSADGTRVVASLREPLAGGKSVRLRLTRPQGCSYQVTGSFEDETDIEPAAVDLCKDSVIRLVE